MNDFGHHVDSFDEDCWKELVDYSSFFDDAVAPADLYWNPLPPTQIDCLTSDAALGGNTSQVSECAEERECQRKRGRGDQSGGTGTKACRERMRREKLNDRFAELHAILEPGRPVKTDKSAILDDAIKVVNQLKSESQEHKEMNDKLLEEIKILKAEKNELREEKLVLKTKKERLEQKLNTMAVPPTGFMPPHPPIYQAGANKMPMFPSYSLVPMWQYLPPSVRDTSKDHELRPPAA